MRGRFWLTLMLVAMLGACGQGDDGLGEEGSVDQDQLDEAKADSASSTSTYYRGRFDARKCMFPYCGGVWVRRVNFAKTKCLDGKYAAECYVAELDVQALTLKSAYLDDQVKAGFEGGTVVLRGKFVTGTISGMTIARFVAREAWMAPAAGEPAASDIFYRATDSGIRCIKAPCPSVHVAKLNSTVSTNVDGVDLAAVPGTDPDREAAAWDVMRIGLVIAAHAKQIPQQGKIAISSQAYRRVVAAGGQCGAGYAAPCGPAQLCCYPCGIPGCKHVCMAVDTCPLIP